MKAFSFYSNFALSYALAAFAAVGVAIGGVGTYLGFLGIFVLHPLLDNLILKNWRLPEERPESPLSLALLIAALPFLCLVLFVGAIYAQKASPFEFAGLILSLGSVMGLLGINTAHELVHRKEESLRNMGFALLSLANFSHYGVEHVFGHHKNVATPLDPASARKNEWIYTYYFRSYFLGLYDALMIEHQRLRRKGFFHIFKNRVILWGLFQLFLIYGVTALYGTMAGVFWVGQSVLAVLLLQTVDYIEHYGLEREKKADGVYEGVKAHHSWDCYQALTNYTLINLGFHSHHHLKVQIPFYDLREQKLAPQMPYGYSCMALLALLPPLYFRLMNPRLPQSVRDNTQRSL